MLNVTTNKVSKMTSHCGGPGALYKLEKSREAGLTSEKGCDLRRQQKIHGEGAAVTCDGRLFHRRAAATGNALSPTVNRRVRRTSRDVDEAERRLVVVWLQCLLVDSLSHIYVGDRPC